MFYSFTSLAKEKCLFTRDFIHNFAPLINRNDFIKNQKQQCNERY